MEISPSTAAQLAADVYAVQDDFLLQTFLSQPLFSQSQGDTRAFQGTVGSRLINTQDGFCVIARGGVGYEKNLFMMFRGSTMGNYGADWLSNARCGVQPVEGGLAHIGFSHIFNSMSTDIYTFINQQFFDWKNPIDMIHCIGHSLGGAVATLAANWAKRITRKQVVLYTFGAPKPGLEFLAKSLTTKLGAINIHRVYHATDPVPMVPIYPFTHPPLPGHGHFLGSSNSPLTAGAHAMKNYIRSVKGLSWKEMQAPPPVSGYNYVIEKWLESDGSLNPLSSDTWTWISAGLEYVLKEILGGAAIVLQSAFIGALSLADKIAWILANGIEKTIEASKWVLLLMQKMMQILGMKVIERTKELTQALMRAILEQIMHKISTEAQKALQRLTSNHP